MDATTAQLRDAATRLAEEYFDPVFMIAHKEFEVHEHRRRSLRSGTAEQGLRVWLVDRDPDAVIWLVVRHRSLCGQRWQMVATVEDVEAMARKVLSDWATSPS